MRENRDSAAVRAGMFLPVTRIHDFSVRWQTISAGSAARSPRGRREKVTDLKYAAKMTAAGIVTGAVNGAFGGGGGMVVVPLLQAGGRQPLVAHATAILIILPVCLASAIVYLAGGWFDAELFLAVGIGVLAGGALGANLLGAITPAAATLVFAAVMFAAGVRMIV